MRMPARHIGDEQNHPPVESVGHDAGRHREQHVRQDAGGSHDPEQHRRVALGVDDHQDGHQVEPVADAGDELAGQEPRQGPVAAEELDVGSRQAHARGPVRAARPPAARVVGDAGQDPLDLERAQAGMLRQDQRHQAGDVRRGEAVAGGNRARRRPSTRPARRRPTRRTRPAAPGCSRGATDPAPRARPPRRPKRRATGSSAPGRCSPR